MKWYTIVAMAGMMLMIIMKFWDNIQKAKEEERKK